MNRIILENVSKSFKNNLNTKAFLESLLSLNKKIGKSKELEIIKNINLNIEEGKIIGLIGRNGSGKSTLLRLISGIYKEDKGSIKINGKIISLINLYAGFQDILSMKENIYLLCAIFGLSKKTVKQKLNNIINYAELEEYTNTKLYKFSNGMLQRVAFSTAIYCKPEILLLDEVLEVGDERFKRKSIKTIKELAKKGASVILVGHDLKTMEKNCDKLIWIEDGKIKRQGDPKKIIKEYLKEN